MESKTIINKDALYIVEPQSEVKSGLPESYEEDKQYSVLKKVIYHDVAIKVKIEDESYSMNGISSEFKSSLSDIGLQNESSGGSIFKWEKMKENAINYDANVDTKIKEEEETWCFEKIEVKCEDDSSSDVNFQTHIKNTAASCSDGTESAIETSRMCIQPQEPEDDVQQLNAQENKNISKRDTCDKSFNYASNLTNHVVLHDSRPHKCEICEKSFDASFHLRQHMVTHKKSKSHECPMCKKSFKRLFDLRRHLIIHNDSRPHKCQICGKSFKRFQDLRRHLFLHSNSRPHKCEKCDKAFKALFDLRRHHLLHKDSRPHKCEICDKAFKDSSNLRQHMVTHNESRPYKCEICGKSFKLSFHLRRHLLLNCDHR